MGWLVLNWGDRGGTSGIGHTDRWCAALRKPNSVVSSELLEGHAAAGGLYCPTGLELGIVGSALGQLLRTGLPQRRAPGLGRYHFSEVNDGPGQENPDRLIRCLVDDAYQVWVERDRMIQHITNQIRSLPWVPVTAMAFKLSKRSSTCRICSRDRILRDMWVRIFYVGPSRCAADFMKLA